MGQIKKVWGKSEAAFVCHAGSFDIAEGPIIPDHIVYSKSYPLVSEPTKEAVAAFRDKTGYFPKVIACSEGIFGVGNSQKIAGLAIELARDGSLIR